MERVGLRGRMWAVTRHVGEGRVGGIVVVDWKDSR